MPHDDGGSTWNLGSGSAEADAHQASEPGQPAVQRQDPVWGHYQRDGVLGTGGMGEVYRVRDPSLGRTVALKVARADLPPQRLARFVQEARVTAQLQHPGIVAVHELGTLPDGRRYFTMKEIRGRELKAVIAEVHAARGQSEDGWTLRRLVDAFRDACEAVAYAHSRGVVHRDLKPANIMVGGFGEVVVVDWGLAKLVGHDDPAEVARALEPVSGDDSLGATLQGVVQGTPAYMPPEQALGEVASLGPAADVYALGAVLFEILSGGPPFVASSPMAVLRRVMRGKREPLEGVLPIPAELRAVVERAMQPEHEARYPNAQALAADVGAWLDGVRRHEDALTAVQAADALVRELDRLRQQAVQLRREAAHLLDGIPPYAAVEDKLPGWRKEDTALQVERQAVLLEEERVQHLHAALRLESELAEAHERLADHYRVVHERAQGRGQADEAARAALHLRIHDRGRHAAYLRGEGRLSLVTEPAGARVVAHRYVERDRRLVLEEVGELGRTPLDSVALPAGSYLLVVEAEGFAAMRYPVLVPRGGHWDGAPPGGSDPQAVPLLRPDELEQDDCYVPAGWTWVGGDPDAVDPLPRSRVWVPGFVVKRCSVTVGEYRRFLDDLVAAGAVEEALECRPRASSDDSGARSPFALRDGRFVLRPDDDEVVPAEDWPVVSLSWGAACRFAAHRATRTRRPWRLLHDLEWEKAARGVDGRHFPWGNHFEPTWARTLNSQSGPPGLCRAGTHPVDQGPCGARDLAGLVRDWCINDYVRASSFDADEPVSPQPGTGGYRFTRGGICHSGAAPARASSRFAGPPAGRWAVVGFRLARSVT